MERTFHSTHGPRYSTRYVDYLKAHHELLDHPDHVPMSRKVRHQFAAVDLSPGDSGHGPFKQSDILAVSPIDDPSFNSIVSLTTDGQHVPMIDLDFDCELRESSAAGHYHLILHGTTLNPAQYSKLLNCLNEIGILQDGNLNRFEENGMSVLRKAGREKHKSDQLDRVHAPWTPEQVAALEAWIERTGYDGYRCEGHQPLLGQDKSEPDYVPEHSEHPLTLTPDGWRCRFGLEAPTRSFEREDYTDPMWPWEWDSFPAFILTGAEPANPRQAQVVAAIELSSLSERLAG